MPLAMQGPEPHRLSRVCGVGACRDALPSLLAALASAVLNVLGLLLGVVTAAILGAFKDAVSAPAPAGLAAASASACPPWRWECPFEAERPEPAQDRADVEPGPRWPCHVSLA